MGVLRKKAVAKENKAEKQKKEVDRKRSPELSACDSKAVFYF